MLLSHIIECPSSLDHVSPTSIFILPQPIFSRPSDIIPRSFLRWQLHTDNYTQILKTMCIPNSTVLCNIHQPNYPWNILFEGTIASITKTQGHDFNKTMDEPRKHGLIFLNFCTSKKEEFINLNTISQQCLIRSFFSNKLAEVTWWEYQP